MFQGYSVKVQCQPERELQPFCTFVTEKYIKLDLCRPTLCTERVSSVVYVC